MDMEKNLEIFQNLSALFKQHGFKLYLVGGTVRDYLLRIPLTDMDAVTDATPENMKTFLLDADYTFCKFGSIKYHLQGVKFDITTLREEKSYLDSRHPNNITFVKDLSIDVKRRDFTINGLYLNDKFEVIDLVDGQRDLKDNILRCIGEADKRIKEDPLRIIRALRFAIDFDLTLEENLQNAIKENISLLDKLNKEKIKQDIRKLRSRDMNKISPIFAKFNITHLLDVLE
jgi:tRNA nucleotidyltransferase (CCA-adding enzyme)